MATQTPLFIHRSTKSVMNLTKSQEHDFQTLSDRLSHALAELGVTQAELARRLKVSPQIINYLCKGGAVKSQLTYEIADTLGINGDWLANNSGIMKPEDDLDYRLLNEQNRVPIIRRECVMNFLRKGVQAFADGDVTGWLLSMSDTGKKGFAIEVYDKSMYPRFERGTIIIINQEKEPRNKEFVVAYIHATKEVVFRLFEINVEGIATLRPISSNGYKTLLLERDDYIIGTLVEARWHHV